MSNSYEIRDPIHGFIQLNDWELSVVNHPAFQRLRRIRQLGLSELVYPGTTHTRFEHSLGVMHVGTRMFDKIVEKRKEFLMQVLGFNDRGLDKDRVIVRFACLLHDLGHCPFSHVGESVMPVKSNGKHYKHEDYSSQIVRIILKDVIENHPENDNYEIKADDVAAMIDGDATATLGRRLLWREIVSSQLDADRSDYLLRDSYYAGVSYGHFDLERVLSTMTVASKSGGSSTLAIEDGGRNAAEALIIARYMMFWQVYAQKTRRICDFHASEALKCILESDMFCKGTFPIPDSEANLKKYLSLDDFYIFGKMHEHECGRHSECLLDRKQDRCVYETSYNPLAESNELKEVKKVLYGRISFTDNTAFDWYKNLQEIPIYNKDSQIVEDLSQKSQIIPALKKSGLIRLYVKKEDVGFAKDQIKEIRSKEVK